MTASPRPDDRSDAPDARASSAANLAVLDALLNIAGDAPSFAALFRAVRGVFAYDRAAVLQEAGDALHRIAADPEDRTDRRWPASPALVRAARGRVLVLAAETSGDERA